ncbi:MAG: HlyD family efflux transporter periplasmic adaptor subunit [Cytophagales bacterium]|nr:HlyD family efflux transporter periplasmic adaptor subunit [Cytophagales bacterium]
MLNISKNSIDDQLADKQLYSLKTLRTPNLGIFLARVLLTIFTVAIISLFLPWQQNIRGQGKVTALNPANRPQTVQSAIPGQIVEWYVFEGDLVQKGDTILRLAEVKDKYFDPEILTRLQQQIDAKVMSLEAKELKRDAYSDQITALKAALKAKLQQARNKIIQGGLKVQSDSIKFKAQEVAFANADNIFERNKQRYESGNISLTKFQDLENKYQQGAAKVLEAENKYLQSQADLAINQTDLAAIQANYAEKISKATTDLQATLSEIQETQGSIAKLRNEFSNVQVRQGQYYLIAPQDGYMVKALKEGLGETIKEGEAVASIMPQNPDLAVEMYVQAMDVPLISQGRKVRIEFDGWPALQFSGWPAVSVGTFGGTVQVIDRVNTSGGMFRILIKPDENEDPWPQQLRMGSGIKGWVMLENVSVWYEIWRQLNGFPPSLYDEPGADSYTSDKGGNGNGDKNGKK